MTRLCFPMQGAEGVAGRPGTPCSTSTGGGETVLIVGDPGPRGIKVLLPLA